MLGVRAAKPEDRATLGAALASAFAKDPLFGWIAGPKAPLEARMRIMFDTMLKLNLQKPDTWSSSPRTGPAAAIWQPIGKWKLRTGELVRAMPAMLRAFRARTPAMIGALTAIEKVHPSEPHYYLEVLGTRQDQQSKGVGSSVISLVLDRCDEEGVPAYLESSNPQNIPFYARHGFEVREEIACGKGAPVVTTMSHRRVSPTPRTRCQLPAVTVVESRPERSSRPGRMSVYASSATNACPFTYTRCIPVAPQWRRRGPTRKVMAGLHGRGRRSAGSKTTMSARASGTIRPSSESP